MKTKHTPGPWMHKRRARDGHVDVITTEKGKEFIAVGVPYAETPVLDHPHDNIQTANARLIAAAPDMLKHLQLVVDTISDDSDDYPDLGLFRITQDLVKRCHRVINEATGE